MKRIFVIITLFLALLASRIFFINESKNIISYITLINSISFIIVIISIIEEAFNKVKSIINNKTISLQLKKMKLEMPRTKRIFCI